MTISWYSVKEHNPEDFGNVFELIESKFVEYKTDIYSNNKDFVYSDLRKHFVENCLNKIDYVKIKFSKTELIQEYYFEYYLKLYHNVIIIKNNIDISNYDFKLLCDIIKSDMSFQDDLNKIMTDFNNEQSVIEPTTNLIRRWGDDTPFKPWYKIESETKKLGWGNTENENVYIKISNIKINTDFSYLFEFFKPKNLIYLYNDSPFDMNTLEYLKDYISTTHRVQSYSRDFQTKYIIPLHNKTEVFISHMYNECSNFIKRIQENKHCFEPNINTIKKFNNVETQTALSLRHFD